MYKLHLRSLLLDNNGRYYTHTSTRTNPMARSGRYETLLTVLHDDGTSKLLSRLVALTIYCTTVPRLPAVFAQNIFERRQISEISIEGLE